MRFNQTNRNAGDVINDGVKQSKPAWKRIVTRAQLLEGFLMNWPDCPAHPGGEVIRYFYCNPICIGDEIYEVDEPTHSGGILAPVSREFVDAVPMTTNEAVAILEEAGKRDPKVREALIVFSSLQQCPDRGIFEKLADKVEVVAISERKRCAKIAEDFQDSACLDCCCGTFIAERIMK